MKVSPCSFCGKDFEHGAEGMRVEDWTNVDRSCRICSRAVCSACSLKWGSDKDNVQKICRVCAARAGLTTSHNMTYSWIDRIRIMVRDEVKEVVCPGCGLRATLDKAKETWVECYGCGHAVCRSCSGTHAYTFNVNRCRDCEEKHEKWQADHKAWRLLPENNCQFCDGYDRRNRGGRYNPDPDLAQVFACTLCGRRICDNCKENRRTNHMNVFCCRACMADPRAIVVRTNPFRVRFEGEEPGPFHRLDLSGAFDRFAKRLREIFDWPG